MQNPTSIIARYLVYSKCSNYHCDRQQPSGVLNLAHSDSTSPTTHPGHASINPEICWAELPLVEESLPDVPAHPWHLIYQVDLAAYPSIRSSTLWTCNQLTALHIPLPECSGHIGGGLAKQLQTYYQPLAQGGLIQVHLDHSMLEHGV